MKPILLLLIFTFSFELTFSQGGTWTWVSGDSTLNAPGVYGTQGIPSLNNHPPAAYEYVEWKDKQGKFWIYGGTYPHNDDLWKFDPVTNEWTWVKGTNQQLQQPHYGIQGVADPANSPGTRYFGTLSWVDTSGLLWLFSGDIMFSNDLWKYDISTNEWTWMKGDTNLYAVPVFGVQGVPDPQNVPGGRDETCSGWTDSLNNLWLFGGYGTDISGNDGALCDVWKYNINTNEWTWMSGNPYSYSGPFYGTKGVANSMNDPGSRLTYTKWIDTDSKFWIMGGYDLNGFLLNDVWKYEPSTTLWTWMAGPSSHNNYGSYGPICEFNSTNNPMARSEQRSSVTDDCGRFWLYGGMYSDSTWEPLSDLWIFDSSQLMWSLLSGSNNFNAVGNYGTLGVASASNFPRARMGAVAWWGIDNRFYMLGGLTYPLVPPNTLGDLWVFTPDSLCVSACSTLPVASMSANNLICPGTCTGFTNLSMNALTFQWSFLGGSPDTSTAIHPSNICYNNPGSYSVTLIASNANGSDTLTLQNYITVFPQPPAQSITQSSDTLFAIAGSSSYQWYFNGNSISGATDYFYVATTSGDYNVVATDNNGCEVEAVINNVAASIQYTVDSRQITAFPNPVTTTLDIRGLKNNKADELKIFNVYGEKILEAVNCKLPIANCQLFPSGLYYIEITSDKKIYRTKFIKQ